MKNFEGWNGWRDLDDTSGDWLTLTEAAQLYSNLIGSTKTIKDVLKAGYIEYTGVGRRLPIFVVMKNPVLLQCGENILDNLVFAGKPFRLHPTTIESLLLLNRISLDDGYPALRTLTSEVLIDGWRHRQVEGDQVSFWMMDFESYIGFIGDEAIIDFDNVRIDGEDFNLFIDQIKVGYEILDGVIMQKKPSTSSSGESTPGSLSVLAAVSIKTEALPWVKIAQEIFVKIKMENANLSSKKISEKVRIEMEVKNKSGEANMTGRGGRIPSTETILRQAARST